MRAVRHLVVGALAVVLGAAGMQYALTATPDRVERAPAQERPAPDPAPEERVELPAEPEPEPDLPTCDAPDSRACTEISGRVVYIESVDPDGDGDLHVVVFDPRGISAPGVTSIDVAPGLRPSEDPRVGERVAAAGPVQTGSFGQEQIHALDFVVLP